MEHCISPRNSAVLQWLHMPFQLFRGIRKLVTISSGMQFRMSAGRRSTVKSWLLSKRVVCESDAALSTGTQKQRHPGPGFTASCTECLTGTCVYNPNACLQCNPGACRAGLQTPTRTAPACVTTPCWLDRLGHVGQQQSSFMGILTVSPRCQKDLG